MLTTIFLVCCYDTKRRGWVDQGYLVCTDVMRWDIQNQLVYYDVMRKAYYDVMRMAW
jgi:hypothetical protein